MSTIHNRLKKEVPLKELFKSPTIKELNKFIESAEENPYSNIDKVEEKEYYETSSAQNFINILETIARGKEMSIDDIILECSERYFDDSSALNIFEEQFNI